jgi:hypothetical protein
MSESSLSSRRSIGRASEILAFQRSLKVVLEQRPRLREQGGLFHQSRTARSPPACTPSPNADKRLKIPRNGAPLDSQSKLWSRATEAPGRRDPNEHEQ